MSDVTAVVSSVMTLETASNASTFHGNSQFLQMVFDKYGDKDDVIPYEAFERLFARVGIVVVLAQPDRTDRKLNRSEPAQAHSPHPFHDHRNDVIEGQVLEHYQTQTETVGCTTTHGPLRTSNRRRRGQRRLDGAKGIGGDPTLRGHSREERAIGKHNHAPSHVAQQVQVSI